MGKAPSPLKPYTLPPYSIAGFLFGRIHCHLKIQRWLLHQQSGKNHHIRAEQIDIVWQGKTQHAGRGCEHLTGKHIPLLRGTADIIKGKTRLIHLLCQNTASSLLDSGAKLFHDNRDGGVTVHTAVFSTLARFPVIIDRHVAKCILIIGCNTLQLPSHHYRWPNIHGTENVQHSLAVLGLSISVFQHGCRICSLLNLDGQL